jgi:DNA-directed DNA polymerase III PolC
MSFVHLNVHSNHSLLSGANRVEDLVWAAAKHGMEALALTDTNGLYAAVPFQRACAAAGVRPIFGAEVDQEPALRAGTASASGGRRSRGAIENTGEPARAVLLARDAEGYAEICRLVTERHLGRNWRDLLGRFPGKSDSPGSEPFNLVDAIRRHIRHAFILTPSEPLLEALASAPPDELPRALLFAELQNFRDAESRARIHRLARTAERLGIETVATNRVHFLRPEGHRIHRVLCAIRTNATVGSLPPHAEAPPEAFFKSPAAMEALFREFPGAVARSAGIARECRMDLGLGRPRPPRFPVPPGESAFSILCKEAFAGLTRRYRPVTREAYGTLSRELAVIEKLDLADYFLICWDIVRWARERGMPCLGRGSAANSIVSYCLFITHVDPLRHNLFFERFLNDERTTPPDFDIDFGTDDREEVLDYVFARHGRDRVAMICTLNQMHARSAMREAAKALGVPTAEIDDFVKRLPAFADPDEIEETMDASPVTRDLPVTDEPFRTLLPIAKRIGGFPRHLATHPCGIVVAPAPVTDFMPLQLGDKGLPITQWSMYPVEDAGLIKIDLLGQKGLAVIPETIRAVEQDEKRSIDPERIDYLGDPLTKRLMSEGATEGCFYIESPIMQQLLRQARCDDFEVLTALSSIIRPGVSNYGGKQAYLRRHLGLEKTEVVHPILEPILRDTYGCLIYQEQVIQIAAAMAGMSLGEADGLRKCMSKKGEWKPMETYKARFHDGARAQGIPGSVIDAVYRQIESFAGYAFCKAHSASYALESFESLYWKAHHPAEFMAAVLSNQGGYYSASEYVEEARRIGLRILLPHVNASEVRFTAERALEPPLGAGWGGPRASGSTRPAKRNAVRVGLMQVRDLRAEMAEAIVAARRERPFASVRDLLARVQLDRREAENLVRCGALDGLGPSRPTMLWEAALAAEGPGGKGAALGGRRSRGASSVPPVISSPEYDFERRLALELEILDLTVSAHPLALAGPKVARVRAKRPTVRSVDLEKHVGEAIYAIGWYVTGKLTSTQPEVSRADGARADFNASSGTKRPRKGELMEFVTFSDEWGRFEVTLFPKAFQRLGLELRRGKGPFLIRGRVELEMGIPGLVAGDLALL